MNQNKLNAIIIAGILVVGTGAWAGPIMTAHTANEFQTDLQTTKTLQTAIADKQKVNFKSFGLDTMKQEIFNGMDMNFMDHTPTFAGPMVQLESFIHVLVPPDTTGETVTAAAGNNPNVFGAPVTLVEYIQCDTAAGFQQDLDGAGGTGPALIEDCEPAIVDKLFIKAPAAQALQMYRLQVAYCENTNMVNHENDGSADNNPANDRCGPAGGQNEFNNAVIILDTIFELSGDHSKQIVLPLGAIPPTKGNGLMARIATDAGQSQTATVWTALKRVGGSGGFDFAHPAMFGGGAMDACLKVIVKNNTNGNPVIVGATVKLNNPGGFETISITDGAGLATFDPMPEGFAFIDVQIAGKPVFFIDRPVKNAQNNSANSPNNANVDANCNETVFTLPAGV